MRLPYNGQYPITQVWGNKLIQDGKEFYAQFGLAGHNGTDIGLPSGTEVLAPHSGKVIESYFDPSGYGNYIKIENAVEGSILAHLQEVFVEVGFQVKEGDLIAKSDNTGLSTGPHLHWGYYKFPRDRKNGYGGTIDPTPFIDNVYQARLKVGFEIKPNVVIAVGKNPGEENVNYGIISPTHFAKIIDVKYFNGVAYYNIDQTYIGGGTGWVKAQTVDEAPAYKPSEPTTPPDPELARYKEISLAYGYKTPDELKRDLKALFRERKELQAIKEQGTLDAENVTVNTSDNLINVPFKLNIDWLIKTLGLDGSNKGGAK